MTIDDCTEQDEKRKLIEASDAKPDCVGILRSFAGLDEAERAWRMIHQKSRNDYYVIQVPLTIGAVYAIVEKRLS